MAIESFHPVSPEWSPVAFAEERQAWQGAYPDAADVPIRIEAAAFRGRPVSFRIVEPSWRRWDHACDARSLTHRDTLPNLVAPPMLAHRAS